MISKKIINFMVVSYLKFYKFVLFDNRCIFCDYFSLDSICSTCFEDLKQKMYLRKLPKEYFEKELEKVWFDNFYFLFSYSDFYRILEISKFNNRLDLLIYVSRLISFIDEKIWNDVCKGVFNTKVFTFIPNHEKINNYLISLLLANWLSKYNINIVNLFTVNSKKKRLQHLIKDRKERILNAKDKFILNCKNIQRLENSRIIIFDDVSTTGSTLNEASKLIKEKVGNVKIDCLVIAKA